MSKYTKRAVSLPPEVVAQIELRAYGDDGNFSGALAEGLSRYYEMLRRERVILRAMFSEDECGLLLDVGNGTAWHAWSVPLLAASVEDSAPDGYAQKWGVDLPALVAKLAGLSYAQNCALVDAIERWWASAADSQDVGILLA